MKLSIDTQNKHTSKPTSGYASINKNIADGWQELEPFELAELVKHGCSFSCGHFDGERKATKWLGQQLFAIDIDDIDSPTPAEAVNIIKDLFNVKPMLLYNSFSSTSDNNKYRIVIAADSVISNRMICLGVLRGLAEKLSADKACVDLARLFYGTTPDKLIYCGNHSVSTDILTEFAQAYQPKQRIASIREPAYDFSELSQPQLRMLISGLKAKRVGLLRDGEHRYRKLTGFCYWLMNLDFMSAELAKYIICQLIEGDEELADQYITGWDKDYADVADNIIDWCEVNYA